MLIKVVGYLLAAVGGYVVNAFFGTKVVSAIKTELATLKGDLLAAVADIKSKV
jgi:hypothetical protein